MICVLGRQEACIPLSMSVCVLLMLLPVFSVIAVFDESSRPPELLASPPPPASVTPNATMPTAAPPTAPPPPSISCEYFVPWCVVPCRPKLARSSRRPQCAVLVQLCITRLRYLRTAKFRPLINLFNSRPSRLPAAVVPVTLRSRANGLGLYLTAVSATAGSSVGFGPGMDLTAQLLAGGNAAVAAEPSAKQLWVLEKSDLQPSSGKPG